MNIAILGLGLIGSIWARHWKDDGHQVRGWNRSPQPAHPCFEGDLRRAVQGAQLVAVVVSDAAAVRAVLEPVSDLLRGATVAVHSTIGVDQAQELAALVRGWGGGYLDMPFTGSKPAAEQRQNVFFVGDDAEAFAAVEPVYARISKARVRLGGVGRAATVKLAMNLGIAGVFQATVEAMRLAEVAGVPRQTFFEVLDLNVARSGVSELKRPKLLAGDFAPQFSVKHMHKDLRLALTLAARLGQELPLTAGVERSYQQAADAGLSEQDFAALVRTLGG
jgi:3-hydroxyisobutyrate dehydrogenase-like beta-hydroxyacid dehydrogenase